MPSCLTLRQRGPGSPTAAPADWANAASNRSTSDSRQPRQLSLTETLQIVRRRNGLSPDFCRHPFPLLNTKTSLRFVPDARRPSPTSRSFHRPCAVVDMAIAEFQRLPRPGARRRPPAQFPGAQPDRGDSLAAVGFDGIALTGHFKPGEPQYVRWKPRCQTMLQGGFGRG